MPLKGLMTPLEPLGPIDQSLILLDQDAGEIVDERVAPFEEALNRQPMLLLGRKGSGKSSLLTEFKLRGDPDNSTRSSEIPPPEGSSFLVLVDAWDEFFSLSRHVTEQYKLQTPLVASELIPTEYLASLWENAVWDKVIQHFYNYCHDRTVRSQLLAVEAYMNADGSNFGRVDVEAKRMLEEARACILEFARKRRSRILFLVDSMERYPIRNVIFGMVLAGLLQGLRKVQFFNPEIIRVTFCLPEELEHYYRDNSDNILKDFSSSFRITWRPISLLQAVAHRIRLYARTHQHPLADQMAELDLHRREGLHSLFQAIMPKPFTNCFNEVEDPLAYIVRHTQLLPRHILITFNEILSQARSETGDALSISETHIREGVGRAEKIVALQITDPYVRMYPQLVSSCENILPYLAPIFTFSEMQKIGRRFKDTIERDIVDVWKTLFAMGVIGRIADSKPNNLYNSTRYCFAEFYYNIEGQFSISDRYRYCIHPIFSRHYGLSRGSSDDTRVIYPYNVDMVTI